jgi:hypothetical protein
MSNDLQFPGVNTALIDMALAKTAEADAREKQSFVPVGDPNMDPAAAAGGGMPPGGAPPGMPPGMPPGGDPMAMGGMPPGGDPMAMGGMPPGGDPMAMGGMPPPAPGGVSPDEIRMIIQEEMAKGGGGGAGGAAGGIKPKIDVNVEIMQMKKILAKISDALGVQIPAAEMVATPEDLSALAEGGAGAGAMAGEGGGAPSAIQPPQPIDPMQAAAPAAGGGEKQGNYLSMGEPHGAIGSGAIEGMATLANRASAIAMLQGKKNNS